MNTQEWAEAGNYPTPVAAMVARARLEAHGIAAEVFDAELANSWVYTNALGGVRLMVAPDNLAAAREILAGDEIVDAAVVADEDVVSDDAPYCARCHSKDVEIRSDAKGIRRLFGFRKSLRCRACGNSWAG
jgi:hypothetical protein